MHRNPQSERVTRCASVSRSRARTRRAVQPIFTLPRKETRMLLQRLRDFVTLAVATVKQAALSLVAFARTAVPGLFLATVAMDVALLKLGTGPVIAGTLSGIS